jgi:hypothetical protein
MNNIASRQNWRRRHQSQAHHQHQGKQDTEYPFHFSPFITFFIVLSPLDHEASGLYRTTFSLISITLPKNTKPTF